MSLLTDDWEDEFILEETDIAPSPGARGAAAGTQRQYEMPLSPADIPFGQELANWFIYTEKVGWTPAYRAMEAYEEDGVWAMPGGGLRGLHEFVSYPTTRLASRAGLVDVPDTPPGTHDFFDKYFNKYLGPATYPVATAVSIATDPKSWLSAGSTGMYDLSKKLKPAVRQSISDVLGKFGDETAKLKKETAGILKRQNIEEGSKVWKQTMDAVVNKKYDPTIPQTFGEQAAKGQRGLININPPFLDTKKPLLDTSFIDTRGEGVYRKFDDLSDWLAHGDAGDIKKLFVTKPHKFHHEAWDIVKKYDHSGQYFTRKAFDEGLTYKTELGKKLAGTDITHADVFKYAEVQDWKAPDDIHALVRRNHWYTNEYVIPKERALDLKATYLDDDITYMPHVLTQNAKKALKDESTIKKFSQGKLEQDPHTFMRKIRGKTASEVNEMVKKGEFDHLFKEPFDGDLFYENPVVAQTIRNITHEAKVNNARFLHEFNTRGLDQGWVKKIAEGEKIPDGFKKIEEPGAYENIVKDYVYREPEALLIEGKTQHTTPKDVSKMLSWWDTAMTEWKKGNLLWSGAWYMKNAFGNLMRMFQAGFSSPDALKKSFSHVKNIYLGKDTAGTIKTARGTMDLKKVIDAGAERGVLNQGIHRDVADSLGHSLSDTHGFFRTAKQKGERFFFAIHQKEEDITRLAMYLDSVKKGYNFDEAAKISFDTLFDYQDITHFEKNIVKRFFSPFYTYYSRNIPFQVKSVFENPRRMGAIAKVRESWNRYQSDKHGDVGYQPEWVREGAPIQWGDDAIALANLLPAYELYNIGKNPALYTWSKTNPVLQVLGNWAYGKDYYTGQETGLIESAINSWRPTANVRNLAEAVVTDRRGRTDEPFERGLKDFLVRVLNPYTPTVYSDTEKAFIKNKELQELVNNIFDNARKQHEAWIPGEEAIRDALQYHYQDQIRAISEYGTTPEAGPPGLLPEGWEDNF